MGFFYSSLLCLILVQAVVCDYRLEVELVQYTGTGRLSNGECCDLELAGNVCGSDVCDVQFIFQIQNINDQTVNLNSLNKGAGRYDDMNVINFGNCQELRSTASVVASNPLTFDIPTSDWGSDETLRLTITVQDYDAPLGADPERLESVGSPFFELTRPSAPSETFSGEMTTSSAQATIKYRYRVICTDGTCGDDCSQIVNCQSWSPACDGTGTPPTQPPVTDSTSPDNPCFPNPCRNEGTCMPISSMQIECTCIPPYEGTRCNERMDDTTDPQTTRAESTESTPIAPSASTVASTDVSTACSNPTDETALTCGASGSSVSHWLITVTACSVITMLFGTFIV